MPYYTIPYHSIPYLTPPHHAIPYHTIPPERRARAQCDSALEAVRLASYSWQPSTSSDWEGFDIESTAETNDFVGLVPMGLSTVTVTVGRARQRKQDEEPLPPPCTTSNDCESGQSCCNWDNAAAEATTGVCGEFCITTFVPPETTCDGLCSPCNSATCPASMPDPGGHCSLDSTVQCNYDCVIGGMVVGGGFARPGHPP